MIKNLNTYRKKSEAVITHRCRGSLKAGISIRHGKGWFEGNAWRMWKPITDSEWGTTVLTPIAEIRFCPFCGQKLEVANKRGQMSVRKMLDDIIWLTESEEKDEIDQMIDETLRRIDK